ncbi:unnamed protein product [Rhizophagus irregularis]|nr:unnamed protein product [Rhizophagus irregularis]
MSPSGFLYQAKRRPLARFPTYELYQRHRLRKLWLPIVTDSAGYPCNQHHLYLLNARKKSCPTSTRTSEQAKCTQSFSETIIETSDGLMSENLHGFMRQKLFCKTQAGVYVVPFISTKGAGKIGE